MCWFRRILTSSTCGVADAAVAALVVDQIWRGVEDVRAFGEFAGVQAAVVIGGQACVRWSLGFVGFGSGFAQEPGCALLVLIGPGKREVAVFGAHDAVVWRGFGRKGV